MSLVGTSTETLTKSSPLRNTLPDILLTRRLREPENPVVTSVLRNDKGLSVTLESCSEIKARADSRAAIHSIYRNLKEETCSSREVMNVEPRATDGNRQTLSPERFQVIFHT